MGFLKGLINAVADPRLFFLLAVAALVVMVWKREQVASNAAGYGLLGLLSVFFIFGTFDPELPSHRHQARQRADRRADLPAGVLCLVLRSAKGC